MATTVLGGDGLPPEDVRLVLLDAGAQFTPGSHPITLAILPCWLGQQYYSEVVKLENLGTAWPQSFKTT